MNRTELEQIIEKYWDGNNDEQTGNLEDTAGAIAEYIPLEDTKNISALIIFLSEYLDIEQQRDMSTYFIESLKDWESEEK